MGSEIISGNGALGLLASVVVIVTTWLANKYVIPFLQVGRRQRYAALIATLADEVTDELRQQYPQKQWLLHLDEAVDRLIDILGLDQAIAQRAVRAAAARRRPQT